MSEVRKDSKNRVLRKGEFQRKSDGRYAYTYSDYLGKRRTVYAWDLGELREKEKEIAHDQYDNIDTYVAGKADVNYLFDRYIKTKTELKESSLSGYIYNYNKYVRDGFGKKKISDVKYSDVIIFYQHLFNDLNLSVSSVENIHLLLFPAFKMAVRDDIIRKNPCEEAFKNAKAKSGKKRKRRHALTKAEQEAFLSFVKNDNTYSKWYPLFIFLFGTGCRIGEAVGIRWKDVKMKDRIININHDMSYHKKLEENKMGYTAAEPKTEAGNRDIPMADEVHEILSELRKEQLRNGFSDVVVDGMTGFIFTNREGNIHNSQTINRAIERIRVLYNSQEEVKAAKEHREPVLIRHFSCHNIRHTFCTRLCEVETNLKTIQYIMGHKDIQTTMDIYAEATKEATVSAMEKMNNVISFS